MTTARVHNRMPRSARANPGRRHLKGADVTAKMQRQYEHILTSLRDHRRFSSDARRKSIAAATVRKLQRNPGALDNWLRNLTLGSDEERAEQLAEEFHGRPPRDYIEVVETENYDQDGAVLGYLVELAILMEDEDSVIPISFPYDVANPDDNVLVVANPAATNIEFVGGDQDIDWHAVDGAALEDKYLVAVGPVYSIAYFADKQHLSGPANQKDGIEYEHEFGEDGGELPYLVFDRRNTKLLLVGGEYTIEPEGITG